MLRTYHKAIVFCLIAVLAIVAAAGEGLHYLPGYAHGILVGNRVLMFGIDLSSSSELHDNQPGFSSPHDDKIPVYTEDECPVCSTIGQSCTAAHDAPLVFVLPFLADLPDVVCPEVCNAAAHSFQARAPPVA